MRDPSLPIALHAPDLERAWGGTFDDALVSRIEAHAFRYVPLTNEEQASWIAQIDEVLKKPDVITAGAHRAGQWEKGWGEHEELIKNNKDEFALMPRYYGKYPVVRWRQSLIKTASPHFEYYTATILEEWLFKKYFSNLSAIHEFGCGTGHNLMRAHTANPRARLYGYDWAESSQKIIALAKEAGILADSVTARRFDFFHPDADLALESGSGIYTVAALEQTGDRFRPFVNYLLAKKPEVCVHIEPIAELLDPAHQLDRLATEYFWKRNYLDGFLIFLRELEREGKIVIHEVRRSYTGSLFVEGHSFVAWSPR